MTENPAGTGSQPSDYGAPTPPPVPPAPSAPVPPAPSAAMPPPVPEYPISAAYGTPPGDQVPPPAAPTGRTGGFDTAALQNFDPKSVDNMDWGIIATGVIALIFSTFSFYTYKVSVSGFSTKVSFSAWHGFLAPVAVLLALIAAGLLAAQLIAKVTLPFPVRLVTLAAFAVAALFLILALFVVPGSSTSATGSIGGLTNFGVKVNKGHGIGYWITLLSVLVGTGLSYQRFTATGGKLPNRG